MTTPSLPPAAVTAARERLRLERTAGRSTIARMLVTASLAVRRLGSPEAAEGGLRYRPVAWTIIALMAVAWYLPGRPDRAVVPEIAAAPGPAAEAPSPSTAPDPQEPPAVDVGAGPPPPSFTPAPVPVFDRPAPDVPALPSVPTTTLPVGDDDRSPSPLAVRGSGWASRLPPTPLPADDVPDGRLPVANRLGSVERVSFVRLAGDGTTLELVEDPDAAREVLGPAAVAVCPIVDPSWSEEPGQSFDDVPEWDESACVAGSETDGRWRFDLSSFDDVAGDAGFALVPTTEAPPDFQVAFVVV